MTLPAAPQSTIDTSGGVKAPQKMIEIFPNRVFLQPRCAFDTTAFVERLFDENLEVIMKRTVLFLALVTLSGAVLADQYVNGYTRKDGTYVQGHTKSSPDEYRYNNKGSQTYGGNQRDEYSSGTGATNRSNSSYGWRDNDRDNVSNPYDRKPESKRGW